MIIPTLTTPRLLLRPFEVEDAPEHHRVIYNDPEVMRYLPGGVPRTLEQTQMVIDYFRDHWDQHGIGGWVVIHRTNQTHIGHCGLNRLKEDGAVEIFYALAKPYWGQGLTPEAAQAVLRYGFEVAHLTQIIALAVPENTPSRRVMEKIGMRFEGITQRYYNSASLAYYTSIPQDTSEKG